MGVLRVFAGAAMALGACLALTCCSGGGVDADPVAGPPSPSLDPTPEGLWRVVAVTNVQSEGLLPLPVGSRFSVSNGVLEWASVGASGPRWYADLETRLAFWQHPFDYYRNEFANFPVDYGYGWSWLGHGEEGTAVTESFHELDHGRDSLSLRYQFYAFENFRRIGFLMCYYQLRRDTGNLATQEAAIGETGESLTLFDW